MLECQEIAERHRVGVVYEKYKCRTFDSDMFTNGTIELLGMTTRTTLGVEMYQYIHHFLLFIQAIGHMKFLLPFLYHELPDLRDSRLCPHLRRLATGDTVSIPTGFLAMWRARSLASVDSVDQSRCFYRQRGLAKARMMASFQYTGSCKLLSCADSVRMSAVGILTLLSAC